MSRPGEPTPDAHVVTALLGQVAEVIIPLPAGLDELDRAERVQALLVVARRRGSLVSHLIDAMGAWDGP